MNTIEDVLKKQYEEMVKKYPGKNWDSWDSVDNDMTKEFIYAAMQEWGGLLIQKMIDWFGSQRNICLELGKKSDADLLNGHISVAQSLIDETRSLASLQTPSNVRWVKASERLPEKEGTYYCKYGNEKYCLPFDGHDFLFAIGEPIPNEEIEWLDESPIEPNRQGWARVEDAPKDGTEILGYDPNTESIYIVWWNRAMGNGCWNCASNNYIPKISHWMPLPNKPSI